MAVFLAAIPMLVQAWTKATPPGIAYFGLLLPEVVFAGALRGTACAAAVALVGGCGVAAIMVQQSLVAGLPLRAALLDMLMFLPSCAAVLWTTHTLRRSLRSAAATEARLVEVFRQIPGAAAILEAPEGRLLLRSSQSEAVLGHPEKKLERSEDMVAYGGVHADGRIFAPDDYPIVRALRSGEVVHAEQITYRQPDGALVDLEVHAGPVRGPDGRILASVGMAFDVTQRVTAERRLRDSEALQRASAGRLRAAVDAGALGLWEIDLETDRVALDARFAAMLGLPAEPVEMERSVLRTFIDPNDREAARAIFEGAAAGGPFYADEYRVLTPEGAVRWLVSHGAVLSDQKKVVGVVADITDRREREDALGAALRARDILMREADHRIKNSLQLVVSMLRLQLAKVAAPDARHTLSDAIARVDAVANAHLALQSSPDFQSIDVDRMLYELCDRIGTLNTGVTIVCDTQAGVWLDADLAIPLGLLVSEVLTNALKHAFPAGATGTIDVSTRLIAGRLDMRLADDGIGLPATRPPAGLGTTVIATLAKQIGAVVTTESSGGRGTSVAVQLDVTATRGAAADTVSRST